VTQNNVVGVNRERAEAAITDDSETDLLSSAAIEAAGAGYADEIARRRRAANGEETFCSDDFKYIAAQESQLRAPLSTGALSADVAIAALDALDANSPCRSKPVLIASVIRLVIAGLLTREIS
jgi:hypothetical protein